MNIDALPRLEKKFPIARLNSAQNEPEQASAIAHPRNFLAMINANINTEKRAELVVA